MLKISRNLLIAGILSFVIIVPYELLTLIASLSNSPLIGLAISSIMISTISIISFILLTKVSLWGGILGAISSILSIGITVISNFITRSPIFMGITITLLLFLASYIIIFVKILEINWIASLLGFIGITINAYVVYLESYININLANRTIPPQLTELSIILSYSYILYHIFYGLGFIISIIILSSIIFKNTGEAIIKFNSQIQGYITSVSLNGIDQAITYSPRFVKIGYNEIIAKFSKVTTNNFNNFILITLENGNSLNIKIKVFNNT